MFFALLSIGILNTLDSIFTFIGIKSRLIFELNPLMKWVWDYSPESFLAVKMCLSILLIFLAKYTHLLCKKRWFRGVTFFSCSLYIEVLILHLRWIFFM
jgi:hypothetical protein